MKKIRLQFLAQINVLIGVVLSFLGCGTTKQRPISDKIMCLYGVPTATYKMSGTVNDQQHKPVANVHVVVKGYKNHAITDTLTTDNKGHYKTEYTGFPTDTLNIVVTDPEGIYNTDSVQVPVPYSEKNSVFDQGVQNIKTNIKLKKK